MRPLDGAQVWFDDVLVGWLANVSGVRLQEFHGSRYAFKQIVEVRTDGVITEHTTNFMVDRRAYRLDAFRRVHRRDAGEMLGKAGVPAYADESYSPMDDSYLYSWKVLAFPDVSAFETFFDFDCFEPCEQGERDHDSVRAVFAPMNAHEMAIEAERLVKGSIKASKLSVGPLVDLSKLVTGAVIGPGTIRAGEAVKISGPLIVTES